MTQGGQLTNWQAGEIHITLQGLVVLLHALAWLASKSRTRPDHLKAVLRPPTLTSARALLARRKISQAILHGSRPVTGK